MLEPLVAEPVTLSATGEPVQSATVTSPLSPVTSPLYSRASDTEEGKNKLASFSNFTLFWVLESSLSARWHHQISPFPFRHLIFLFEFSSVDYDFGFDRFFLCCRYSLVAWLSKKYRKRIVLKCNIFRQTVSSFSRFIFYGLLFLFILFICCVCYGSPMSLCSSRWTLF